jgi:hypothetical protein
MSIYAYSRIKNYLIKITSKAELLSMLASPSIESAIKNIIEKPIGVRLYNVIRSGNYNLLDLFREIESFNNERIGELKSISGGKGRRVINVFEELFDTINLAYILISLSEGGKPSIIIPAGSLLSIDLSKISSIEDLRETLRGKMPETLNTALYSGVKGYQIIFSMFNALKKYRLLSLKGRRIYGFIHDLYLLKTCMYMSEEPIVSSILTLTRDQFINGCRLKNIDQLVRFLSETNPIYSNASSLLSDLLKLSSNPVIFDLGIFLYASNLTNDMIYEYLDVVIRVYIIIVTEAFLLRSVLTSLWFRMFIDEFKSIIDKWWII